MRAGWPRGKRGIRWVHIPTCFFVTFFLCIINQLGVFIIYVDMHLFIKFAAHQKNGNGNIINNSDLDFVLVFVLPGEWKFPQEA